MSYDNALSPEQMGALVPGDAVSIETWGGSWRYPDIQTGTVVRLTATQVVVSATGPNRAREDRFRRKDGYRIGDGARAQLIDPAHPRSIADAAAAHRRRRQQSIDSLANRWSRNPDDLDLLRDLHVAIGEYLDAETETHP